MFPDQPAPPSPELLRFARLSATDGQTLSNVLNTIWGAASMLREATDPEERERLTQILVEQANVAVSINEKTFMRARNVYRDRQKLDR